MPTQEGEAETIQRCMDFFSNRIIKKITQGCYWGKEQREPAITELSLCDSHFLCALILLSHFPTIAYFIYFIDEKTDGQACFVNFAEQLFSKDKT
jgi:hypothetical protein